MKPLIRSTISLLATIGIFFVGTAIADSPVKIDVPDAHSIQVKGKVNLYRVQIKGMNFGEGKDTANAEVLVTLDSKPGMIFTLSLYEPNSNTPSAVNKEISETLRAAYVNKTPVTLYHQLDMKRDNNFRILMVQMD